MKAIKCFWKYKQIYLLLLVLFSHSISLFSQEVPSFSLEAAVQYAADNNLNVRNAQINIADAEAQIIERRAIGLPQINGDLSYSRYLQRPIQVLPEAFVASARDPVTGELPPGFSREVSFVLQNSFNAGINLNALIFDGTYFVGLRAARRYREYVQRELESAIWQVRNQVVETYLPTLLLNENLEILDRNIENVNQLLFETRESYKAGFVEQLDVDRLELSKANLEVQRDNLERQREVALNALKFSMGYPVEKPLTIEGNIENLIQDVEAEDLTENINYENRPEFNVTEAGLKLAELNIEQYRMGYFPSVSGSLSYGQTWQGDDGEKGFWAPSSIFGLRVNVPIFDGFDKKAKIERARLELEKNVNLQQQLKRGINLEVENSRTNYLSAKERLRNQERNLELAERIYKTTQIKYQEGVGSSIELSQAEQGLYQAQQNYIQGLFDVLTAKVTLDKALGNSL